MMRRPDPERALLLHVLGAIAYRTQKAVRSAPREYAGFAAGNQVRTPVEILRHMTSLMGYTRTLFVGGSYPRKPTPLPDWSDEVARFHEMLEAVADVVTEAESLPVSAAELLQGPLADTLTHVGQLALLRRLAGSPVPPESFIHADIQADRLGADQPEPVQPDEEWPERPDEKGPG
jgi:hypothetical protein